MTSHPRQFQGHTIARQEMPLDVLPGDAARNDPQRFDPVGQALRPARCSPAPSCDGRVPVSNLSISSWYAISGTAMA